MSLAMHQAFEITIRDVKSYNYKDGTQQLEYQCMTRSLSYSHTTATVAAVAMLS
jgi:hypothetical protein